MTNNTVKIIVGTIKSTHIVGGSTVFATSSNIETITAENASANSNTVTILDGSYQSTQSTLYIYGGKASATTTATANNNTVTISGGLFQNSTSIYGASAATSTTTATATTATATANNNTVNISGGSFQKVLYIRGGRASAATTATANNNTVNILDGSFNSTVTIYGGYITGASQGTGNNNTVAISGGSFNSTVHIYGGYIPGTSQSTANNNTVAISGGSFNSTVYIYGGYISGTSQSTATAANNTVNILGGSFNGDINIYGGYSTSDTSYLNVVSGNTLNISSKASFAGTATAYNFAKISFADSGTYSFGVSFNLYNAQTGSATTTLDTGSNDVTLEGVLSNATTFTSGTGGTLTLNIAKTGTGKLTLSGNNTYTGTTTIEAGTLSLANENALSDGVTVSGGTTYGSNGLYTVNSGAILDFAFTENGTVNNSIDGAGDVTVHASDGVTVTFSGEKTYEGWTKIYTGILDASSATLSSTSLYMEGGATFHAPNNSNGDTYTLAKFVVNAENGKSVNYKGADLVMTKGGSLDIFGPANVNAEALLLVDEAATLDGVNYSYTASGAVPLLEIGDKIHLIQAKNGLSAVGAAGTHNLMTGTTITYGLTEEILESDGELNLVVSDVKAAPQAKALLEGSMAGLGLVTQGADMVAGRGMEAARAATSSAQALAVAPFAAVQGGSLRYNSGSHIDMQSLNLMAGLAVGADTTVGNLTAGAFFEFGNGSYNTYNAFNTGSYDGNGNTYFVGWGLLGRMDFLDMGPGHVYVEASGRMGGLYNTYENDDMRDSSGRRAEYDRYNAYYGFHAGLGYVFDFTEAAHLDVHGKYFWTRVDGEELTLSTGEALEFEDVTSSRLRFGTRFTFDVNEKVSPYIGFAYEHEFDGRARGTTMGYDISSPSIRGDTGIGEIGISLTPSELPITLDFTVQGHVGKREGVMGSVFFKYTF